MSTIINVGRQFGSGGLGIANEIGKRLNIKVYDKELITKDAEESGFSKELFKKTDEKRNLFNLSGYFVSGRFGSIHNYLGDNDLFKIQSDVIRKIATEGQAIFVGRCANYILRDMKCLDVFVTAPMEDRIKRVADRSNLSPDDAKSLIEKNDRTREAYYNFFTFGSWGHSTDYDLCVDSSILGIEGTAEFIIDFGKKAGLI
jgi:cytidylate kinase